MKVLLRWLRSLFSWRKSRPKQPELSEREVKLLSRVILRDQPGKYDISRLKR